MFQLRIEHPYYTRLNRAMLFETREEAIAEIRRRLSIDADNSDKVFYHSLTEKEQWEQELAKYPDDDFAIVMLHEFEQYFKGNGYYDASWNPILLDSEDPDHAHYNDYNFTIEEINDEDAEAEEADDPYECRLIKTVIPIRPRD